MNRPVPASLEELNTAFAGSYTATRLLGEGGMAVVYLAEDHKHGRQVAIKVVKSHLAARDGGERFLAEIRTTATLNHPGILPLFDSGTVDGHAFYVMPVVEGESLQDRLEREGLLSAGEAGRIVAAAARALDYAHRKGIVHRDIKPSNLLLHAGHTMVADFGISFLTGSASRVTATGVSLGTPHYMSPEQFEDSRDPDGRSDQYALGCVLFEMLEGHAPFPMRSAAAVLAAHLTQPAPSLSSTAPEARALDRVIQRAMAKDADDRFATILEMAEAVEAAIAPAPPPGGGERRGLVVLPFTNMSADPADGYFSDGLTEEVIGDLSRMQGLRVISRTSAMQYKGTTLRLPEIAEELGVRYVLEGGVRKGGERLRVSAQLIDAKTEQHLWSDRYDGVMDDIFEIQDNVAASIAGALSLVLTSEEKQAIQHRRMPDAEALEHYMKARQAVFTFDGERMREGIEALEPLLESHGDNLQLLKGLAYLHWNMMNAGASTDPIHPERVVDYAARMKPLDGGEPWAKAFRGMLEIFTDPVSGGLELLDGLEGLSGEPDMLWWAGGGLGMMGLPDLGEPYIAELKAIDPKGDYALFGDWVLSVYRGRWADALRAAEAFPEHLAANGLQPQTIGWTLGCMGDTGKAVKRMEQTDFSALEGGFAFLGRILLAAYRGESPLPEPDAVQREAAWRDWQYSAMMADAYAQAGEHEEALRWLSHGVELGFYQARFMSHLNAHLVGLRDDPRFGELMKQAQLGAARMRRLIEDQRRNAG